MTNQLAFRRTIGATARCFLSNPHRTICRSTCLIAQHHFLPSARRRTLSTAAILSSAPSPSPSSSQHHDGVLHQTYYSLVNQDEVHADHHQIEALHELERLRNQLISYKPPVLSASPAVPEEPPTASFGGWFSQYTQTVASAAASSLRAAGTSFSPIQGAYLHGGVGCGKTFLLNLFYDSLDDVPNWRNERQKHHFHRFMLQIHQAMHAARYSKVGQNNRSDAILPTVIDQTLRNGRLVYLDEFQGTCVRAVLSDRTQSSPYLSSHSKGSLAFLLPRHDDENEHSPVTDVADALILQRLFTGLWERGAIVVASSNRPPDELYWNGIQRDRFLPFIDLLKRRCHIVSMWDSETDYRLVQKKLGTSQVYFVGKESRKDFDKLFYTLADGSPIASTFVQAQGRQVPIPQAVLRRGLARFSFEDLCQKALGAADYLQIGQHFHTVFVERVPLLTINEINWVRRFITFVDAMYESHVRLVLHAPAPPNGILQRGSGSGGGDDDDSGADLEKAPEVHDEFFAFDRTASRLEEMQSQRYLQRRWAGAQSAGQQDPLPIQVRLEPA